MNTLLLALALHASPNVDLRWIPGSTVKVTQLVGDCDYTEQAKTGVCVPTTSRTSTNSKVLGTDLGSSFESDGKLIFLFGDTIGPPGTPNYNASDTLASTTSTDPEAPFLEFFTNPDGSPYFVRIAGVKMGAAEVPEAGIRLNGTTYIAVKTGTDVNAPDRSANTYSVLTRFNETTRTFTVLRTISAMPNGRFVSMAIRESGSEVLMFGVGKYRASNVYLSSTPANTFATGEGTRYFKGLVNGEPSWSVSESDAVPIVAVDPPAVGNLSVAYSDDLGLWLMTYDFFGPSRDTAGVYFTYAKEPWGPWSAPQLIFNARREGALGKFIHDPTIVPNPPGDGLNGPTIGPNDPHATSGGLYAPFMVERFLRVSGTTLSVYYLVSTWNPYTVVEMRSDFVIVPPGSRRRAVRH